MEVWDIERPHTKTVWVQSIRCFWSYDIQTLTEQCSEMEVTFRPSLESTSASASHVSCQCSRPKQSYRRSWLSYPGVRALEPREPFARRLQVHGFLVECDLLQLWFNFVPDIDPLAVKACQVRAEILSSRISRFGSRGGGGGGDRPCLPVADHSLRLECLTAAKSSN